MAFPKVCRVFPLMVFGVVEGLTCFLPAVSCFGRWCCTCESTKFFLTSFQKACQSRDGNAIQTFGHFATTSDDTLHLLKFCLCHCVFAYMQGLCE